MKPQVLSGLHNDRAFIKRWSCISILLCLATAQQAVAYLGISLELNRNVFLRYEPVKAIMTIRNYSGNTIEFSEGEDSRGTIRFTVFRDSNNYVPAKEKTLNLGEGLRLPPGETRRLQVVLNHHYNLQPRDSYHVTAQVEHRQFSHDMRSKTKSFTVKEGMHLWSQMVGIPSGEDEDIPSRKMTLIAFGGGENDFYALQIEDRQKVYATIRLGRRIMGRPPEYGLDDRSNFHILIEIQARLYLYRIVSCHGEVKQTKYLIAKDSIPRLKRNDTRGTIRVEGGTEGTPGVDFRLKSQTERQRSPRNRPPQRRRPSAATTDSWGTPPPPSGLRR